MNIEHLAERTHVFAMDVSGDGRDDVVLALGTELRTYYATGNGRFQEGPVSWWAEGKCATGDADGDGRDDLVCHEKTNRRIVTRRATPTGWSDTAVSTNGGGPPSLYDHQGLTIHSGDVDGDGLSDVVLARAENGTRVVLGRSLGDGTYDWNEEQNFPLDGDLQTADVDGDGKLDLVFSAATASVLQRVSTPKGFTLRSEDQLKREVIPPVRASMSKVTSCQMDPRTSARRRHET